MAGQQGVEDSEGGGHGERLRERLDSHRSVNTDTSQFSSVEIHQVILETNAMVSFIHYTILTFKHAV
jgi:hypothetical protein